MIELLPARIAEKIEVDRSSGCWNWTACRDQKGYGYVSWKRRARRAHAVVYEILVAPMAAGLEPEGYVDWHEWAERMGETHVQERCEGCGLLNIWVEVAHA